MDGQLVGKEKPFVHLLTSGFDIVANLHRWTQGAVRSTREYHLLQPVSQRNRDNQTFRGALNLDHVPLSADVVQIATVRPIAL